MDEAARPAGERDLPELARLAELARREAAGTRGADEWARFDDPPTAATLLARVERDRAAGVVLVGTLDDVVVGYALVERVVASDGSAVARVHELFVEPDARGVGVAEALVDSVLGWAVAHTCVGVEARVLPGNREGKNLFERVGLTARAIVVYRAIDGTRGERP